jgi:hypothetical protein
MALTSCSLFSFRCRPFRSCLRLHTRQHATISRPARSQISHVQNVTISFLQTLHVRGGIGASTQTQTLLAVFRAGAGNESVLTKIGFPRPLTNMCITSLRRTGSSSALLGVLGLAFALGCGGVNTSGLGTNSGTGQGSAGSDAAAEIGEGGADGSAGETGQAGAGAVAGAAGAEAGGQIGGAGVSGGAAGTSAAGTSGSAGAGGGSGSPGGGGGSGGGGAAGAGAGGASAGSGGTSACEAATTVDRKCAIDTDCMAVLHTTNCCGAATWLGIRAAAAVKFATLEQACDATYPKCGCAAGAPVAEDGSVIPFGQTAGVTCVSGTCKTFSPECGHACDAARSCLTCGNKNTQKSACSLRCMADRDCTDPVYTSCQVSFDGGICVPSNATCSL